MKRIRILVLTLLVAFPFAGSNAQTCDLHKKVEAGDITAVRNMLEAGCDVDAKNWWGDTPLYRAAYYYQPEIAQMLLDAGANVDFQSSLGWTPLHRAAVGSVSISNRQRREDTVRVLLDANANVKLRTNFGKTPLHMANMTDPASVFQMLIDAGADVNAKDHGGWTPLYSAALEGSGDAIRAMVKVGADVNAKDNDGNTPLHIASVVDNADVIRVLFEVGADVNAKDNDGNTPLHVASMVRLTGGRVTTYGYLKGNADAIRVLLELGADDQIKNNAKFKPKAVGKTKEIRKLLKTPGLYWPIKAYAMGNASSDLIETSARVGCADKKKCRVFLECTDKDGDEFKGSLDSASKVATDEDSIDRGATVSLSASEIKTITGATGDDALDCALRSHQRITAQVWSSTDSVNANTTAYRLSENNEARIQFKVGESNTPFVNIRCLAATGKQCTKTKLVCTDDRGRDWPKIKAGTIDRLNVYTVSTVQGADHRINKNDKGWYSCAIESENPFMVYATHFSTKGDSRSLVSTTAVSME